LTAVVRAPKPAHSFETAHCPLCGPHAASHTLFHARDWDYPCAEWFGLHRCRNCHLVFVSPRPSADHLADYYPATYPAHVPLPQPSPNPPAWRSRLRATALAATLNYPAPQPRSRFAWAAPIFRSYLLRAGYPAWRPHGSLLDVGCGRGNYLHAMRQLGWDVMGLDLSPRAVEQTRRLGIPALQGRLCTLPWPRASFDVITFFDSFEHHPDPVETLHAAARLLRRNGSLLIRFPNFDSVWRRIFRACWADIAVPRHLYHYTPATLSRLVTHCGFSVDQVYVSPSADFSRSLQAWERARGYYGAPRRPWAQHLDPLLSFGHCLLRAHRT
jgi:SAM-dependent methyltransferase